MFSFLWISDNELVTKKDMNQFQREGVKIYIFFLFNSNYKHLVDELGNNFGNLNYESSELIDIWTYFGDINDNEVQSHQENAYFRNMEICENKKYRHNLYPKNYSFKNMELLARFFDVDISLQPCFVICDIEQSTCLKLGYTDELTPTGQIKNIINILKDKEYDWNKISEYYKSPYSLLRLDGPSLKDKLSSIYNMETKGIKIQQLRNEGYNIDGYLKKHHKSRFQNGEPKTYIKLKDFLYNFKILTNGNKELRESMQSTIDSYIINLKFKNKETYFPELKNKLESASFSFLNYAMKISEDEVSFVTTSRYSLACYCIGKVIENEINLGYVQKIREKMGIDMPRNYNQFKQNYDAIIDVVDKKYDKLDYNSKNIGDTNTLRYPDISRTRDFLFDFNFKFNSEHKNELLNFKKELNDLLDYNIKEAIKNIFVLRNNATHSDKILTKDDFELAIKYFRELINHGFFENNTSIKFDLKK